MTPQQLIGLAVRFFAIWLAITSIAYFLSIPTSLAATSVASGNAISLAYGLGALYLLAAIFLWFCPMLVAHKLLPRTQFENRLSFQAHELARVGVALLGLWLLSKALPSLVWLLFRSFLFVDAGSSFSALTPEARLEVFVALFEAGFALLVIFKAKVFAGFIVPECKTTENDL
jgi:hypothetical protein